MAERERLQKLMSQAGIASRRDAETYLIAGRVMINGQVARLGDRADLSVDDVRIDGEPLQAQTHFTYIMVNKPMQVVTAVTRQYQEKRQTVRDLVQHPGRLFPVGRLDADSEGLVLMTDDGDMAERMTHPRFEHAKVYDVLVRGDVTREQLAMWERGVVLDDGQTLPAEVKVTEREPGSTRLRITMREGRKRQIRRIAVMLGHPVIRLLRLQIGPILLGNLRPGEWRELTKDEIDALKREAGTSVRRVRQRSRVAIRSDSRHRKASDTGQSREHRDDRGSPSRDAARNGSNELADFVPPRDLALSDSAAPGAFRSNPNRPSRMKNERSRSFEGDIPKSHSESRPESRATSNSGRAARSVNGRAANTEEIAERAPFKRPVAPPSRARSKPPSRHPESSGKPGSPAASKPSRSARAPHPDRPARTDKAARSERTDRPDRVERAARPADRPNRAARRAAGPTSSELDVTDSVVPTSSAGPRKPRKRPESASRSQKPSKSPHSGSRSQGGRPKKSNSQSGTKGASINGKSATKSRPKSDKSDSEK